jgi:hypothetical protein
LRVQLLATENEYELTIADAVVDTSEPLFAFPARDMRFTVTRRSDGEPRKVMFRDTNTDGLPGNGDILYILEEDATGELAPAWELKFSATANTIPPEPGDTFLFVPLRKLSSDDVFEFIAAVGVGIETPPVPEETLFLSSYPSADAFSAAFDFREALDKVTIDVSRAHIWDISSVAAIDMAVLKFRREGAEVELVGMNKASETIVDRLAEHDKPGAMEKLMGH